MFPVCEYNLVGLCSPLIQESDSKFLAQLPIENVVPFTPASVLDCSEDHQIRSDLRISHPAPLQMILVAAMSLDYSVLVPNDGRDSC